MKGFVTASHLPNLECQLVNSDATCQPFTILAEPLQNQLSSQRAGKQSTDIFSERSNVLRLPQEYIRSGLPCLGLNWSSRKHANRYARAMGQIASAPHKV